MWSRTGAIQGAGMTHVSGACGPRDAHGTMPSFTVVVAGTHAPVRWRAQRERARVLGEDACSWAISRLVALLLAGLITGN